MTVLATLKDGRVIAKATSSGPSSYSSGGFDVTVTDLRKVEEVLCVRSDSGYLCEVASTTNNVVKVKAYYFDYDATADGAAIEPTGADLSGVTFTVIAIGY